MSKRMEPYLTWKSSDLIKELKNNGITVSNSTPRNTLRSLYKLNVLSNRTTTREDHQLSPDAADGIVMPPDVPDPEITITQPSVTSVLESIHTALVNLNQKIDGVSAASGGAGPASPGNAAQQTFSETPTPVDNTSLPNVQAGSSRGVPISSLDSIDVVSDSMKKRILEFKYVDLAALLVPNYTANKPVIESDGETLKLNLKEDKKLKKVLSITEFVTAFGVYKRVMCTKYERQQELDEYERMMIRFHSYLGEKYYDYHVNFTQRAAAAMDVNGIKIDWSKPDQVTLMLIGLGKSPCKSCGSQLLLCACQPANSANQPGANSTQNRPTHDKYGRRIVYYKGKQICNNFNTPSGCERKDKCKNQHVCINKNCHKDHAGFACPSKN